MRKGQEGFGFIIALILFLAITAIGILMLFFSKGIKDDYVRGYEINEDIEYNDLVAMSNSLLRYNISVYLKSSGERVAMPLAEVISMNADKKFNSEIEGAFIAWSNHYKELTEEERSVTYLIMKIEEQDIESKFGASTCYAGNENVVELPMEDGSIINIVFRGCNGVPARITEKELENLPKTPGGRGPGGII